MKTNTAILAGGLAIGLLFLGTKKKTATSAAAQTPIPTPIPTPGPTPTPKPKPTPKPGEVPKEIPDVPANPIEDATADEKKYIDFYYNLGWYKLTELDTNTFGVPENLSEKGNKSNGYWLTDIAYWAMYSAPGNEHNTNAPWDVRTLDHTNAWRKIWERMYGYARTLVGP